MLYSFLRFCVQIALKLFYRKIYFLNLENIPKNKGTILVCNHPSGFLEPCTLACFAGVPLYFLARGDLFKKKWLRAILENTHQIPVYRFRDGFSGLRNNSKTIESSINLMLENKHLLIFSEGGTEMVRRIRPLRKGVSRIVRDSFLAKRDIEISVVPIGFNVSHPRRFGSAISIVVGKPIDASSYFQKQSEKSVSEMNKLMEDIRLAMEKLVPHVRNKEDENLMDKLVEWKWDRRWVQTNAGIPTYNEPWIHESLQVLAEKVNGFHAEQKHRIDSLISKLFNVMDQSSLYHIPTVNQSSNRILIIFLLVLGFIPWMICSVFTCLPIVLAKLFTNLTVKGIEFYMSVWVATSIGLFMIQTLILAILVICIAPWYIFMLLLLLPASFYSVGYGRFYSRFRENRIWQNLDTAKKQKILGLDREVHQLLA